MNLVVLGCGKRKRVEVIEQNVWLGRCTCDLRPASECDLHRAEAERSYRIIQMKRSFPIVELYTGPLYQLRLAYARRLGGPHLILSAFYGAQPPAFQAVPYERSLADMSKCEPARRWYDDVVRTSILRATSPGDRVVALASRPYVEGWAAAVRRAGRVVETPLAGMGMGQQLRWLRARLAETPRPTPRPLALRVLDALSQHF
ncbi:MAG: hypothetical protein M5U28_13945 [Sandaracinaceae bacterium]|nr:hypothetical protein [Sandaracinaceae bacterium]